MPVEKIKPTTLCPDLLIFKRNIFRLIHSVLPSVVKPSVPEPIGCNDRQATVGLMTFVSVRGRWNFKIYLIANEVSSGETYVHIPVQTNHGTISVDELICRRIKRR